MDDGNIVYNCDNKKIIYKDHHIEKELHYYDHYELDESHSLYLNFSFETQKSEDSFNIKISAFFQDNDLSILVTEKHTVEINFDEEIVLQRLHILLNGKNKSLGKIVNNSTINTRNLILCEKMKFINKGIINFLDPITLVLQNCCLENDGDIFFKKKTTIKDQNRTMVNSGYNPFLYYKPKYGLINNRLIISKDILKISCPTYISESGWIHSYEQILFRSKGPSQSLLKKDVSYPIIDIVRVSEELTKKIDNSGLLGEEMAMLFYKKFMHKSCFSYKANNQGNGIDVIAYEDEDPKKLIIHESKNYITNNFELDDNQMTKIWVHYYLFKVYQICIEKLCHEKQTGIKALSIDEIKKFLEYTLNKNNKELLSYLDNFTIGNNQFNPQYQNDIREILGKNLQKSVIEIDNNLEEKLKGIDNDKRIKKPETKGKKVESARKEAETNKKKLGISCFRDDLNIVPRGNSIIHCNIPKQTDLGFNIGKEFTLPTYFIRHRLDTRYAEMGEVPKN